MKIPMPAAVFAGGASRRMGRPKASLPYGAGTLLDFQIAKLSAIFEDVFVVAKDAPPAPAEGARIVLDRYPEHAAIYGLVRALEEAKDRVFVQAVDLPALTPVVIRAIAARGLDTKAAALIPRAGGKLQPLAAVWRRAALATARCRIGKEELSLQGLAEDVGAEIFDESEWRSLDPSGTAFENINTLEQYEAMRERA
jgi:molybdopterin-guanine dinucleotide biosynthesis protein A